LKHGTAQTGVLHNWNLLLPATSTLGHMSLYRH